MAEPTTIRDGEEFDLPWYHTVDLPGGPTPGEYDLRSASSRVPLPPSLVGLRCLDVGTHDGFWAFEMERRGAEHVVAIDIDDPNLLDWPEPRPALEPDVVTFIADRKRAFAAAHRALASRVEHHYLSVYDLSPEKIGEFDLVFVGTLLHHLRDPVGALMAVRRVCRRWLVVNSVFSITTTVVHPTRPMAELMELPNRPLWQLPNLAGVRRQVEAAGFEVTERGKPHFQRYGAGHRPEPLLLGGMRQVPWRLILRYGVPHVALLARPVEC